MKKNIPYLIIIIVCVIITITSTVVACSMSKPAPKLENKTSGTSETTSTEVLEVPTHNANSEITETETTTETETEEPTETTVKVTEPPVIETEEPIVITEAEPITEEPEQIVETEKEIETEVIVPVISLEFESLGNGTCAVIGIGNVTDTYIVIPEKSPNGDVVTAIEDNAFYGNMTVRAIEIPSTVATIGELAFANCPELVYISVNKSNRLFTDVGGILYSSDMSKLIAYPAASGASNITLPASIKSIAAMAFYNCDNLKTIIYEGTLAEWSKISIGEMNYGLYTASIACTDTK